MILFFLVCWNSKEENANDPHWDCWIVWLVNHLWANQFFLLSFSYLGLDGYLQLYPDRLVYDTNQSPENRPRMSTKTGTLQTLTTGVNALWSTSRSRVIRQILSPCIKENNKHLATPGCDWDGLELLYAHGLQVEPRSAHQLGLNMLQFGRLSHNQLCHLTAVQCVQR